MLAKKILIAFIYVYAALIPFAILYCRVLRRDLNPGVRSETSREHATARKRLWSGLYWSASTLWIAYLVGICACIYHKIVGGKFSTVPRHTIIVSPALVAGFAALIFLTPYCWRIISIRALRAWSQGKVLPKTTELWATLMPLVIALVPLLTVVLTNKGAFVLPTVMTICSILLIVYSHNGIKSTYLRLLKAYKDHLGEVELNDP